MGEIPVRLRPVVEPDLAMFSRFVTEPGLMGIGWNGFGDPQEPARRFAADSYLDPSGGRFTVEVGVEPTAAGYVNWTLRDAGGPKSHWEIGITLLPEWRGQGIGWRAQAMLCDYLFAHTPMQRIEAGTHAENIAEQKSLMKAGFQLEGVVRASEFRGGRWCDGYLYSRLRDDPSPL